jgi:hypothetical protein
MPIPPVHNVHIVVFIRCAHPIEHHVDWQPLHRRIVVTATCVAKSRERQCARVKRAFDTCTFDTCEHIHK